MHITMKPAKMCPKGGSGCPSSINTGVQLKTKMNMEDSKRQHTRPQSPIKGWLATLSQSDLNLEALQV